ncbi:MAG: PUR family DNA/RNA-binding protein [Verrucomicrobiae bacterium]|nr:PUR family DNA/RNA-binding protein [Verrucomicrobiae bacterium]
MITNDRSSYGQRPSHGPAGGSRPPSQDETLKREEIVVERKKFIFTLKENQRGRFLRITEDVNGRRDNIIVPAPGLAEFRRVLEEMAKAAETEGSSSSAASPAE